MSQENKDSKSWTETWNQGCDEPVDPEDVAHFIQPEKPVVHVDEWLDNPPFGNEAEAYARFVIDYFRKPAWQQIAFEPWMGQFKLFCTWRGVEYRVVGASRMGDIWLSKNFEAAQGYTHRVNVAECSGWRSMPVTNMMPLFVDSSK